MTAYAQAIARPDWEWSLLFRIEGIGEYSSGDHELDGWWAFASDEELRYGTDPEDPSLYKAWVEEQSLPDALEERVDPDGGTPESGELEIEILDVGDALTAKLLIDAPPVTNLTEFVDTGFSSIEVDDGSLISEESVIFVNGEAIFVDEIAGNILTVRRGKLGTVAVTHNAGDGVYLGLPYIGARVLRMYLVPIDADDRDEETQIGPDFTIDTCQLSENLVGYRIGARSLFYGLERSIPVRVRRATVAENLSGGTFRIEPVSAEPGAAIRSQWSNSQATLKIGDAILLTTAPDSDSAAEPDATITILRRSLLWMSGDDPESGDQVVQVIATNPFLGWNDTDTTEPYEEAGYRVSFGTAFGGTASGVRDTGAWRVVHNAVDIILCHLLSAYDPTTDNVSTNFDPAIGNWASLPPGFGAGVKYTDLDWDSWLLARERAADLVINGWVFGEESKPVAEVIGPLLRLIRGMIVLRGRKLALVIDRLPLEQETPAATLTEADFGGEISDDPSEPVSLTLSYALDLTKRDGVRYSGKTTAGGEAEVSVSNGTFAGPLGRAVPPSADDGATASIEIPFLRLGPGGSMPNLDRSAEAYLWRRRHPPKSITTTVPLSRIGLEPGDRVAITTIALPNFRTGTRGVTAMSALIESRGLKIGSKFEMETRLVAHTPDTRVGRIAASAMIDDVDANTATVLANRYTDTDTQDDVDADAEQFEVGDEVSLRNVDLTDAGSGLTQTITDITGNDIDLDGNFGGALAAGLLLEFADRDDSVARQHERYSYLAERATRTIGSSDDEPWRCGEP